MHWTFFRAYYPSKSKETSSSESVTLSNYMNANPTRNIIPRFVTALFVGISLNPFLGPSFRVAYPVQRLADVSLSYGLSLFSNLQCPRSLCHLQTWGWDLLALLQTNLRRTGKAGVSEPTSVHLFPGGLTTPGIYRMSSKVSHLRSLHLLS